MSRNLWYRYLYLVPVRTRRPYFLSSLWLIFYAEPRSAATEIKVNTSSAPGNQKWYHFPYHIPIPLKINQKNCHNGIIPVNLKHCWAVCAVLCGPARAPGRLFLSGPTRVGSGFWASGLRSGRCGGHGVCADLRFFCSAPVRVLCVCRPVRVRPLPVSLNSTVRVHVHVTHCTV